MNDVAPIRKDAQTVQTGSAVTPMEMLNSALERGANMDTLAKLMDLQERWEKGQARKAFDRAIAAAKSEIPTISKNRTGHNNKKYADFAAVASTVDPIISQYGLSYRFRAHQDDKIHVTCILSHEDGHSEETTLDGPADTSGNKNAIQAIGSTLTYLQRYSLTLALGLSAAEDDDGKAGGMGKTITEEQSMQIRELIEAVGADKQKFLDYGGFGRIEDIPADQFQAAVAMLNKKKDKG